MGRDGREIQQRIQELSEPQRIEYRRRLDTCYAVVTFIERAVLDRQQQVELIEEQSALVTAKWPWVLLVLGVLLVWIGKELDLPTVTIGYIMGGTVVFLVAQGAFSDWTARRRIQGIDRNIAALRFQWAASGAFIGTLASYCAKIGKEGASTDLEDSPEIHQDLQNALLGAVGAYA